LFFVQKSKKIRKTEVFFSFKLIFISFFKYIPRFFFF